MRTAEIKRRFLAHFEAAGHRVAASAPLPADDPTLLFVNAGMVPFKPCLLGQRTPPHPRMASVQKCVRTLDVDEVGKTTRHGTFFQMNGNFSFGDYFKDEAIGLAWELAVKPVSEGGYGLDAERIWATVYRDDDEADGLWRDRIGLPEDRIVRRGKADNFWSMGVPGPCGPCSELYYDRGPEYGSDGGPEVDEDRFLEFWNLVFMQYERGEGSGKEDYPILGGLPSRNIDTGMGLERMAVLLQGVDNLYEVDETRPILDAAAELTGTPYRTRPGPGTEDDLAVVRLRVIADHVRTALMMIGDGVAPSNEGRGYVLRRILRRAVRSVRQLGYEDPALPHLLPVARDCMAPSYPELAVDFDRIASHAYGEEEAFRGTLRQGSALLGSALAGASGRLPANTAFQLHDTYGFPIDLTVEIAAEQGLDVDVDGFQRLMTEQRRKARQDAQAKKTGHADTAVYRSLLDTLGPTEWVAYETLTAEATVVALLRDGSPADAAGQGDIVTVILDRTPFYAESGGQESDAGTLHGPGLAAEVLDVQRPVKGLITHLIRITGGDIAPGTRVEAAVDPDWRLGARQAHSGTHIVHAALRASLGPGAVQSGSYNRPGYLRLDFSWQGALSSTVRGEIEDAANLAVRSDLPVEVRHMPLAQAREIGALALFGETYDDTVRVVEIGGAWSRELCGGTHVDSAAQVGSIALTGESSVGSGRRRIEAVTGLESFRYLARERDLVDQVAAQLNAPRDQLPERVTGLVARLKEAERTNRRLLDRLTAAEAETSAAQAADIGEVRFAHAHTDASPRRLAELILGRLTDRRPGVAAVTSPSGFVIAANQAAQDTGLSAGDLIKQVLDGRGGGNARLAQGKPPHDPAAALSVLRRLLGDASARR